MQSPTRASARTETQVGTPLLAMLGMSQRQYVSQAAANHTRHINLLVARPCFCEQERAQLRSPYCPHSARFGCHCADWEDLNLERLVLEPSPAAAAAALRAYERPKGTRLATPASSGPAATNRSQSGGTASSSTPLRGGSRGAPYPVPSGELPFDGAHILEAYDLSPATTTGRLEAWLESLQLQPLGPVVRRARLLQWRLSCYQACTGRRGKAGSPCACQVSPFSTAQHREHHSMQRPQNDACSMQAVPAGL